MEQNIWPTLSELTFVGTGTSHFQSEPWRNGSRYASDWDEELERHLKGQSSGIKIQQQPKMFPHLLPKKDLYAERSAGLGMNMFRFSIDLARLNPREGVFNTALMAEYTRLMAHLRISGQEPLVTMHHFTMPLRLTEFDTAGRPRKGAWQHPDVIKHFRFCTGKVVKFLSDADALRSALAGHFTQSNVDWLIADGLAKYFMPINEPLSTFGNSYMVGNFPPYKKNRLDLVINTLRKMTEAYAVMEDLLRQLGRSVPTGRAPLIGNGYNWQYFDGFGSSLVHTVLNEWCTRYMEKAVARSDWMGLHYYCRTGSLPGAPDQANKEYGDHPVFGDIYPPGICNLLHKMHAAYPTKEILVSEIGFSDRKDQHRPHWILETMRYILKAKLDGVPVTGVLYWSMVDNFEWDLGMSQKLGLFSEDELATPLLRPKVRLRSWQVWQAIANGIRHPSDAISKELADLETAALQQHRED